MKRKFSTLMDEAVLRRAKLEAARRGLQLNEVFDLALRSYLALGKAEPGSSVVEQSFGVLRFPSSETRRLLEDEDGLFES